MNRGDVVLIDWQFTDGAGSKLRPAVVVQADYLNGLIDDTILVQITTKSHGIPGTEVAIDPVKEAGSGLLTISYVACMNILTAEQISIDQTIGFLSDATMMLIGDCLKTVLEVH
jgi:mRNA-degrading endonuclease toxin of MazEF toxin-antitoxin module